MEKDFLEIGKIVAVHGIRGDVKVQPWCDEPEFLTEFTCLYLKGQETEIEKARVQKNMVLLKIAHVNTPEDAQKLVGQVLSIHRDWVELPENTYFIADLIGLQVIDADDDAITYGTLTDVSQTGANDVYHILFSDGKTRYIPAIPDVVIETDIEKGIMRIRPLKGLFDD